MASLQAVEQIQLATENKITKEKVKEEEEEWQAVSANVLKYMAWPCDWLLRLLDGFVIPMC
ncbi:hypothetical protein BIW11_03606 [Tropilaelaps mercedesae]|uniref:Uncharacterized protein n=1 Tax=Tropilaelaps mercedesae TaxID=418985 RepID=A0A1V9XIS1_9ACAR|nr:hypothetical protein BIW11_03606 [Tropilaelaps mercedesae]